MEAQQERLHSLLMRRTQYNTKLKEWRFEKNIKEKDMKAIARKKLKRKAEYPLKSSSFRLRGNIVSSQKIEQYMKHTGIPDVAPAAEPPTPSDISCETPKSTAITPAATPRQYDNSTVDLRLILGMISNPNGAGEEHNDPAEFTPEQPSMKLDLYISAQRKDVIERAGQIIACVEDMLRGVQSSQYSTRW
ncbi:MAG: hypothetical protein Q9191_000023 [Dirinaria sp. TL-2023a]